MVGFLKTEALAFGHLQMKGHTWPNFQIQGRHGSNMTTYLLSSGKPLELKYYNLQVNTAHIFMLDDIIYLRRKVKDYENNGVVVQTDVDDDGFAIRSRKKTEPLRLQDEAVLVHKKRRINVHAKSVTHSAVPAAPDVPEMSPGVRFIASYVTIRITCTTLIGN